MMKGLYKMKRKIVIGTRGSILAMAQSEMIKKMLENNFPELEFEIKKIVTSGDTDLATCSNVKCGKVCWVLSFPTRLFCKENAPMTLPDFSLPSQKILWIW